MKALLIYAGIAVVIFIIIKYNSPEVQSSLLAVRKKVQAMGGGILNAEAETTWKDRIGTGFRYLLTSPS